MRTVLAIALCITACAPAQHRAGSSATPAPICEDTVPGGPGAGEAIPFDERMAHPRKLSGPDPSFTAEGLAKKVQGTMVLTCRISVAGCVTGCRVLQSLPPMDESIIDALRRRRYAPATLDGKALEVEYTFKVTMRAMF